MDPELRALKADQVQTTKLATFEPVQTGLLRPSQSEDYDSPSGAQLMRRGAHCKSNGKLPRLGHEQDVQ